MLCGIKFPYIIAGRLGMGWRVGKIGITQMGGRVAMLDLDTCSSHDGDGFCHHFYDHQIPFETFSLLL